MTKATRCLLPLAAAMSLILSGTAVADRDPTAEERQAIEDVLRSAGFTSWEEIEFDDDDDDEDDQVWEVDDAVGADGQEYDLKLDRSFNVIQQKPD